MSNKRIELTNSQLNIPSNQNHQELVLVPINQAYADSNLKSTDMKLNNSMLINHRKHVKGSDTRQRTPSRIIQKYSLYWPRIQNSHIGGQKEVTLKIIKIIFCFSNFFFNRKI